MKKPPAVVLRTFREWKLRGRVVMRGQASNKKDLNGQALFTYDQTTNYVRPSPETERELDQFYGMDGWGNGS